MVKLFSIISKNIKVISRSWIYIVLLFILPTILVVSTSIFLDSAGEENIQMGIVKNSVSNEIRTLIPGPQFKYYNSISKCKTNLKEHQIAVCIDQTQIKNQTQLIIYFDNSKTILTQYTKQYILNQVLDNQLIGFELTIKEVLEKINSFSKDIELAEADIIKAYEDLEMQEEKINEFHKNFSEIKIEFNQFYSEMKIQQPIIEQNLQNYKELQNNININLNEINSEIENLIGQLETAKMALFLTLPSSEYEEAVEKINAQIIILENINFEIINFGEDFEIENPDKLITNFNNSMQKLAESKELIELMDIELTNTKLLLSQNKERLKFLRENLETSGIEIENLKEEIELNSGEKIMIKDAFIIPEKTSQIIFPILIILIIAFTSIILSNMFVIEETHKKSYIREIITPTSDTILLLGDFFISLIIISVQIVILLILGEFLFRLPILNNILYLFTILICISSLFILIGMSLGYIIRSKHISTLMSTFILLFLIMFSDLLIPRQIISPIIKLITNLNPFVIADNLIFNTLIFGELPKLTFQYTLLLIVFLITMCLIAYLCKKIGKYKLMKE
ncbi:MAG: ABC transporter permease [Nanoarchaeota archaeon]|nr:ABC transporter permease [Nanoarchaeota archaeon]